MDEENLGTVGVALIEAAGKIIKEEPFRAVGLIGPDGSVPFSSCISLERIIDNESFHLCANPLNCKHYNDGCCYGTKSRLCEE